MTMTKKAPYPAICPFPEYADKPYYISYDVHRYGDTHWTNRFYQDDVNTFSRISPSGIRKDSPISEHEFIRYRYILITPDTSPNLVYDF